MNLAGILKWFWRYYCEEHYTNNANITFNWASATNELMAHVWNRYDYF